MNFCYDASQAQEQGRARAAAADSTGGPAGHLRRGGRSGDADQVLWNAGRTVVVAVNATGADFPLGTLAAIVGVVQHAIDDRGHVLRETDNQSTAG
jgi:hypothetical protein